MWKKEREKGNVSFAEVLKKQIQDKANNTVIQIIKQKEGLMRDTMDRKKCMVIYGLHDRKDPNKYGREREELELVKKVMQKVSR